MKNNRIEAAAKAAYEYFRKEDGGRWVPWEMLHPETIDLWRTLVKKAQKAYESAE